MVMFPDWYPDDAGHPLALRWIRKGPQTYRRPRTPVRLDGPLLPGHVGELAHEDVQLAYPSALVLDLSSEGGEPDGPAPPQVLVSVEIYSEKNARGLGYFEGKDFGTLLGLRRIPLEEIHPIEFGEVVVVSLYNDGPRPLVFSGGHLEQSNAAWEEHVARELSRARPASE